MAATRNQTARSTQGFRATKEMAQTTGISAIFYGYRQVNHQGGADGRLTFPAMSLQNTLAPNRFEHASLAVFLAAWRLRAPSPRTGRIDSRRQREGRAAVLDWPTGSTPVSFYAELVRLHREEN